MVDQEKIEPRLSPEIGIERGQLFRPVPFFIGPRRVSMAAKEGNLAGRVDPSESIQVDEDKV
jgi:hypothetical protein